MDAIAQLNNGKAMSPRKVMDSLKGQSMSEENKKLVTSIIELRRKLEQEEEHNENLRHTMREMVDDYSRQIELRDNTIRQLQNSEGARQQEISMLVYKENETLKHENRMLHDKVHILEQELQQMAAHDPRGLHDEINRLTQMLQEKDI